MGVAAQFPSLQSFWQVRWRAAVKRAAFCIPLRASPLQTLVVLLLAILAGIASVRAEGAWQNVRGPDLRDMFIDHELADGAHYAYQFRGDGTFTGFNTGKEIRGMWRVAGTEFCWTQRKSAPVEECFEVERRGNRMRLLRDGYEGFAGSLLPIKAKVQGGEVSR